MRTGRTSKTRGSATDLRVEAREALRWAAETGIPVVGGKFGVVESYDGAQALTWQRVRPDAPVCALGAVCLRRPPLGKADNRGAFRAPKVTQAVAAALDVEPDYVAGFAMGFDGHRLWAGITYSPPFQRGHDHGRELRVQA